MTDRPASDAPPDAREQLQSYMTKAADVMRNRDEDPAPG